MADKEGEKKYSPPLETTKSVGTVRLVTQSVQENDLPVSRIVGSEELLGSSPPMVRGAFSALFVARP
jgi:hypothetical protein